MNTLFAGCEPRLPGSLNAMKGINQLSHLASMPFSAAISLFLRLLNLSKPDAAMTKSQSNSCVTTSVSPPLASFSHLSPAYSPASFRQQDSVGHSGPLGPWLPPLSSPRPSRSFRPLGLLRVFFLSLLPRCNLGSVGHSGPLSPLLPPYLLSLPSSMLFHHCLDSVSHSGSLGLWPSPLPSLLLPSPFFEFRFFVSPKSEPSRSFRPTRFLAASLLVFPLTLLPPSPLSYFFSAALTQWVIPAHWVFCNLLSLPCFRPPPAFTLA